ncbi:MAG TPA: phosphoglucosamine mutase [Mycobacteriales bacterium]|nr:phosphoglucosamine mutase [Mycobacteriales bacterium]
MGRLFGTDGVRGLANADLTPELVLSVAVSAAHVLGELRQRSQHAARGRRPVAVVGRDPRSSGEMLEGAVVAGLTSAGADVLRVGVLPTPAVAHLTADTGADLGVMLSASHNPMPDNGVKLFARGGHKLPDAVEDEIEARIGEAWARPTGAGIGRARDLGDAVERYAEHLLATLAHKLDGLRVVVDCANGAASVVAPLVLARAGAEVTAIAAEPDGLNINDGVGSTHLDGLVTAVRESDAEVGIAFDGDADRCLAVTGDGTVVDGDAILAICALALREEGRLRSNSVVATVMSNLGFHHAMRAAGVRVLTSPVGDRYVLETLRTHDLSLGGEQSGHVIFADAATTGDGLLTALQLLGRVAGSGASLAELASVVRRLPQVLVNVPVADKARVAATPAVRAAVAAAERELGDEGRVLLRPSGTEQIVRVMVEAPRQPLADEIAHRIAAAVAAS